MGVPRTKRIKWNQEKKKSFSSVLSMFYSSAKYKFYLHMFSGLNSETISDKKKNAKVAAYSKKSINYHFLKSFFFKPQIS